MARTPVAGILFFVRDGKRYTAPNPHKGDIRPALLQQLLTKQYRITIEEWNAAG
ncbi:MAG TPA: hypothetical protein VNT79_10915 [Phycisphaerae bacterium]|nr:hypothetical protein [Phycisphaerae bacterium]